MSIREWYFTMANTAQSEPALKEESEEDAQPSQQDNQQQQQQNFGPPKRGGFNRFGNRRGGGAPFVSFAKSVLFYRIAKMAAF